MEKFKAFIVGCLGGGIGALVALQSDSRLWWLGLIVGGLIGYIGYSPVEAWQTFRSLLRQEMRQRIGKASLLALVVFLGVVTALGYAVAFFVGLFKFYEKITELIPQHPALMIVFAGLMIPLGIRFGIDTYRTKDPKDSILLQSVGVFGAPIKFLDGWVNPTENPTPLWRVVVFNPITMFLASGPGIVIFVIGVATMVLCVVADLLIAVAGVTPRTFAAIHSDARVLMALSCTIGATVGFFTGSVAVGALSGGFVGALDISFLRQRVLARQRQ